MSFGLRVFGLGLLRSPELYRPSRANLGPRPAATCHKDEMQDWKRSAHGKTMEVLLGRQAVWPETQGCGGSDKDYSKDEKCLKCHTPASRKKAASWT